MKREFSVTGPIHLQGTLRSTDLVVAVGDDHTATVLLESSRDAAERGAFAANTVVELVGDVLHLQAQLPRFFARDRTRVHVTLPAGSAVVVTSGSGDVTCSAPLARAAVRSGSGDVQLTTADDVEVVTGSGGVRITAMRTGRVQTGSGDAWVGSVEESLSTRTGSGDVTVASSRHLESTSGSGNVTVEELRGDAQVRSASGDTRVRRAVSGRIDVRSTSGDVRVAVPRGTAVLLDCSTVSGRMRSELDTADDGPGPDEDALELTARTVSGDLVVTRAG